MWCVSELVLVLLGPTPPHLVPAEQHDVVEAVRRQPGPGQAATFAHELHHLVVLGLIEGDPPLGEHLPHQHAWKRKKKVDIYRVVCV